MSFWDRLKAFFAGPPAAGPGALAAMRSADLEGRLRVALLTRLGQKSQFVPADLAHELSGGAGFDVRDVAVVGDAIERLYEQQFFASYEYTKTWLAPPRSAFVYHPLGHAPTDAVAA